jgi:hypothetical protein
VSQRTEHKDGIIIAIATTRLLAKRNYYIPEMHCHVLFSGLTLT